MAETVENHVYNVASYIKFKKTVKICKNQAKVCKNTVPALKKTSYHKIVPYSENIFKKKRVSKKWPECCALEQNAAFDWKEDYWTLLELVTDLKKLVRFGIYGQINNIEKSDVQKFPT